MLHRFTRRQAIGMVGVGALPFTGAVHTHAQSTTPPATPSVTLAEATPVPADTPVPSPIATPLPPPLQVIRDQQPVYGFVPRRGGTLRIPRPPAERLDFNPTSYRQDYQVFVSYLDPLLRSDPVTLEPVPWLAEAWQVSDDRRSLTFQLRSEVRWHDGSPFTARDVQFSLLAYRDDFDTGVGNLFVTMDDVEVLSELEVTVTLAVPDPGWVFNAATQLIFQAAQYVDYWESMAPGERSLLQFDWQRNPPIGTGPWRIETITGNGVEFGRNDDYWLDPPWFDRFSLTWQENGRDRIESWRAGAADFVWPLRTEDIPLVADLPGRLYVADAATVMFMAFNFANPTGLPRFFDDERLRRALSLGVDRARYGEDVFGGFGNAMAAGTIAQPWAQDERITSPLHDADGAVDLLREAGWFDLNDDGILENVGGVPFDLTVIVRDDARRELLQVLRSVKDDWAEIGVALRIQQLAADQFQARALRGHDFDLIAYAYDLFPGFTDFDLYGSAWDVRSNPQGWNPGGYANADADAAIAAFLQATDVESQRLELLDLQQAVNDDLFGIWLGVPASLILGAIDIDGFQPNMGWQMADTRLLWRTEQPRQRAFGMAGPRT